MKKIVVILLALIFVCFGSVSAFATEATADTAVSAEESSVAEASAEESSVEASEDADDAFDVTFTTDNLGKAATHMGVGMLGVFIVLSLIALVVLILNKLFKPKA